MKAIKTVSYNTNNAWGFGGMIGRDTYFDNGMIKRRARNYHRHTGTSSANQWRVIVGDPEYPDFDVAVRGKKSDKVFVYMSNNNSYRAFFRQQKEPYMEYGEVYKLIKVIEGVE